MADVLVIDDMSNVRDMLTQMLARGEHRATAVDDGQSGIEMLRSRRFGAVVTGRAPTGDS